MFSILIFVSIVAIIHVPCCVNEYIYNLLLNIYFINFLVVAWSTIADQSYKYCYNSIYDKFVKIRGFVTYLQKRINYKKDLLFNT